MEKNNLIMNEEKELILTKGLMASNSGTRR